MQGKIFPQPQFLTELFAQMRHSLKGDQFMGGGMKQEFRVLCGLHRGASLPVSLGDTLTVGSDANSDVVLVDPGVRGLELTLEVTDEGMRYTRASRWCVQVWCSWCVALRSRGVL
jgi:Inner membrane component of T3SS, cytoplasmic domain